MIKHPTATYVYLYLNVIYTDIYSSKSIALIINF